MLLSFTDQLHNTIQLSFPPKRIVSLVPSQTELLYALGLEAEVVGITKFCIHPTEWFKTKQRIGGTKTVNLETVKKLKPDLIIANKEENVKEQIEALRSIAPVWVSDIETLDDALSMIDSIGTLVDKINMANKIAADIKEGFQKMSVASKKPRTCYLIWKDPYMTVGCDTFIQDMLTRCGFNNIFKEEKRYPQITIEQLNNLHCELLLLSSEPYPFNEKHVKQLQQQLPKTKVVLADGEMFSWYGSRLLLAPKYLNELIARLV